jgi:hypothetical protein
VSWYGGDSDPFPWGGEAASYKAPRFSPLYRSTDRTWSWGRDAEEFGPERFGGVDVDRLQGHGLRVRAGRRICPGLALAVVVMELGVSPASSFVSTGSSQEAPLRRSWTWTRKPCTCQDYSTVKETLRCFSVLLGILNFCWPLFLNTTSSASKSSSSVFLDCCNRGNTNWIHTR